MNKKDLIKEFIILIENDLQLAIESQKTTVDYVTHEDNKPENEYDTRGLEASYLARGQTERVADLKECLVVFKSAVIKDYDEKTPIGNTCLIEIENIDNDKDCKQLLMMPKGGGLILKKSGTTIQVVTATSPLGKSLLGKMVGDEINYISGDKNREYEIKSVS